MTAPDYGTRLDAVDAIAKHLAEDDTAYAEADEARRQAERIMDALDRRGLLEWRVAWRAIMTAPRDGTPILAWDGTNTMVVEFFAAADGSSWWELASNSTQKVAPSRILTHWQPLPAPPA